MTSLRFYRRWFQVAAWVLVAVVSMFSLTVQAEDEPVGPNYVALEPQFTLNYGQGDRLKYVQLSVTLEVDNNNAALEVNAHSDSIRHAVIMQFAQEEEATLRSVEGRELVRERLLDRLRAVMEREVGEAMIRKVLFTSIVVQG
ncbi:flagellar basal body-associated FliL family protein [Saccharospirillum mangrovi]|uniref:flagellar basal body-associated FliL family protein n=1 Tax=Saccharospirillum mangrovi TaxID=2161747 RepID=UPI0013005F18|nr:flagellar basal body-associated FliL family protein [Saccharospirillum mangrovi]